MSLRKRAADNLAADLRFASEAALAEESHLGSVLGCQPMVRAIPSGGGGSDERYWLAYSGGGDPQRARKRLMHRMPTADECASGTRVFFPNTIRRVTLVLSELRCGGAERVVVHLAATLRGMGVAAEILCIQSPGVLAGDAEAAGVPVVALRSLRGYDLKAIWGLATEIRRFRPDVINVHDRSSLPYVVLANRIGRRRPVVFSAHGLLMQDGRSRLRDRLGAWGIARVTAVSQPAAKEYARLLGWRGAVEIIDNGVPPVERSDELRRLVRGSLGLGDDTFVYLAVGNVKPEKGFEDLLTAAALLRDRARGRPFAVLIAGGVSDAGYRESLAALQQNMSLGGVVRFLGFRSDARALYSAADAFALTSRKEGLPLVLLEAMSAGLPVVATEVGAVPEVIRDQIDGLLVPPAAPDPLAQGMFRLLEDEALRASVGAAARARIESRYGVRHMAQRYLEVYTSSRAAASRGVAGENGRQRGRPSVLMLGPLPPLTGGMATVIDILLGSDLNQAANLVALNNGKTTRPGRTLAEGIFAQMKLLWRLFAVLRSQRTGIVHLHTCEFLGFWRDCLHALVAGCLGVRVVWHVHGARFDEWAARQGPCRQAVLKRVFERAAAVIVLSEQWRLKLTPFAPRARWRVVANGVPMPRQVPEFPPGPTRFLFLGDWTPRKGVADLVAGVALAVKQHAFRGTVALAGFEKDPGQRERLDRLIAESGCGTQIKVLGLLSGKAKEDALAAAHCLVLPSHGEGLPVAILEAMGYGRPAIATRVGAIPELITDGREGALIEPGDVDALAGCLGRFDADVDLLRRMGRAARKRVENEYCLEVMVTRVAKVYSDVMANNGGRTESARVPNTLREG